LGRPAHFWSNLERQYQENKTRLADKIRLEEYLHWLDLFPVNEMVKLGWIEKCKEKTLQLDALLRFFAIASPEQWETVWIRDLHTAFRTRENLRKDAAVISAWLRRGEIEANQQRCAQFDKQKFQNSLAEIRMLTTENPGIFIPKLESICAAAGVAVVFVPALHKLGIYGAARRFNDRYIMQLSLYGKSNDKLWFTFFHEACHIIKHSVRELYVEAEGLKNEKEDEANAFAQDVLIPPEKLKHFLASIFRPTIPQIQEFAATIGIAPGIVAGRLQYDGKLSWDKGNELKVKYEWGKG